MYLDCKSFNILIVFMQKTLQVGKTQWIFIQTPDKETIDKLAQEYDFHEMIVDDIL